MLKNAMVGLVAAVWLAGVVSAQGQTPAATQKPNPPLTTGNEQRGKQLYLDYSCYACHGFNAQTGNGARLLPSRLNQQQFTLYIRSPRQMPPYTQKLLSDAQVADIYAYVQSLPKAPEAKDIPLLNQLQ
jgi:mono/diheme cytochrome c family protein